MQNFNMKKLLGIVVLSLLLSGNAYAELLRLSCVASDKTMTTNVLIDMSEKKWGLFRVILQKLKFHQIDSY